MAYLTAGYKVSPLLWAFRAKITWRGAFPADMLHYDQCWPCRPKDVLAITDSFDPQTLDDNRKEEPFTATISTHAPKARVTDISPFTIERWRSFGATIEVLS